MRNLFLTIYTAVVYRQFMKLSDWTQLNDIKPAQLAAMLGTSYPAAYRYMHEGRVPEYGVMLKIYELTDGGVTPNDFILPTKGKRK